MSIENRLGGVYGVVPVKTAFEHLSTDKGQDAVTGTAFAWNQPDHITNFIDRSSLFGIQVGEERLHWTVTDTPSSMTRHVMLVQENDVDVHSRKWDTGRIIHEQSPTARDVYWLSVLTTLDHAVKEADGSGDLVFFAENTCHLVTNDQVRLPRSIGLVHGHVTRFPGDHINKDFEPLVRDPGLAREVASWNRLGPELIPAINKAMVGVAKFDNGRFVLPPGYETTLDLGSNSALENARKVSHVLGMHHSIYKEEIVRINSLSGNDSVHQPSYRTYIEKIGDRARVVISPIQVHHAGGITALGIFALREKDNDYPILDRRRIDSVFTSQIGGEVVSELANNGYQPEIIRTNYPY